MTSRIAAGGSGLIIGALIGIAGGGCVADGPSPRQAPRAPAAQPSGIVATVVDLAAARYARDSDKNGFADEIDVTAFLFAQSHDMPLTIPGEFRFNLVKLDGTPFANWTFDTEQSAAAVQRLLPGPGYRFRLSLLDRGPDTMPSEDLQLRCDFIPASGDAVHSRSPIRVTVGKLR